MGNVMFMRKGDVHTAPVGGLPLKGTPLNDCTWEQIATVSSMGLGSEYFAVGDTKIITINGTVGATTFNNTSIHAFIVGIDHNATYEGSNRIHFQIGKINNVLAPLVDNKCGSQITWDGYFTMNTTESNSNGWENSHLRRSVLGSDSVPTNPTANTLLAALPSELRNVMKSVTKYTDNTGGINNDNSSVTSTIDYLPLLSEFEVQGSRTLANSYEQNYQKQYDYYTAGNSKIGYKHTATNTPVYWWLRSHRADSSYLYCTVGTNGESNSSTANYSRGVAPIFCV